MFSFCPGMFHHHFVSPWVKFGQPLTELLLVIRNDWGQIAQRRLNNDGLLKGNQWKQGPAGLLLF